MVSEEIYKKLLLKINKNNTNSNVKLAKSQFVYIFNEEKRAWLDEFSKQKESNDYIEDLQVLLQTDTPLVKIASTDRKDDFTLPANFFKRVSSYALASSGNCTNIPLFVWFIKPKDDNVIFQNDNQKPSFDYQETVGLINNDKVSIYKDNFNIDAAYLTYYREPLDLDIAGYIKPDGTVSTNVNIDLDDKSIEEIIDRVATEVARNYQNTEQLNIALQREQGQKKI